MLRWIWFGLKLYVLVWILRKLWVLFKWAIGLSIFYALVWALFPPLQ